MPFVKLTFRDRSIREFEHTNRPGGITQVVLLIGRTVIVTDKEGQKHTFDSDLVTAVENFPNQEKLNNA